MKTVDSFHALPGLHFTDSRIDATQQSITTHLPILGIKIDNALLGCENAVKFYHTSAVEYLLVSSNGTL
jgi:hypothetical protein